MVIATDPVSLFRFSALTYNSHRIHFDYPYATGTEGFPGLVVHGPYLALSMLEVVRRSPRPRVQHFAYRLLAPTFSGQAVCASLSNPPQPDPVTPTSVSLVVSDRDGRSPRATGRVDFDLEPSTWQPGASG